MTSDLQERIDPDLQFVWTEIGRGIETKKGRGRENLHLREIETVMTIGRGTGQRTIVGEGNGVVGRGICYSINVQSLVLFPITLGSPLPGMQWITLMISPFLFGSMEGRRMLKLQRLASSKPINIGQTRGLHHLSCLRLPSFTALTCTPDDPPLNSSPPSVVSTF